MLVTVVLARSLPVAEFAAYSYFQMTSTMFAAYASLGLGVSASRFFAEAGHERPGQAQVPLGTLITLSLVLACIVLLVVLTLPTEAVTAGLAVPVPLLAMGAAAIALGVVPGGAVLGAEKYAQAAAVSGLSGGLLLGSSVLAVIRQEPSIAMAALVVCSVVQAAGQLLVAGRAVGWTRVRIGLIPSKGQVRSIFAFTGPMMIVSIMTGSGAWIVGRLIIDGVNGEAAFALYSIGMQWFSLTLLVPGMVARVLLPRMVRLKHVALGRASGLLLKSTWLVTWVALAVGVVGVLASPLLTRVYGSSLEIGRWFIAAYMAAGFVNAPLTTMGNAVIANDGQGAWMRITGIWFTLLLLIAWGAVEGRVGGVTGAVAQGISSLVQLGVTVLYCRRIGLV